jgi:MerR family transcriptional regulator/heat shock protein HspR
VRELLVDDVSAPLFTVGQVARMLDVQPAFLRRLDSFGVVSPERSDGGQRRYSREHVERVADACSLIGEGLTLAGVSRVFALQAEVAALEAELAQQRARHHSGSC